MKIPKLTIVVMVISLDVQRMHNLIPLDVGRVHNLISLDVGIMHNPASLDVSCRKNAYGIISCRKYA